MYIYMYIYICIILVGGFNHLEKYESSLGLSDNFLPIPGAQGSPVPWPNGLSHGHEMKSRYPHLGYLGYYQLPSGYVKIAKMAQSK